MKKYKVEAVTLRGDADAGNVTLQLKSICASDYATRVEDHS